MTHDELLARIDWSIYKAPTSLADALRAIVELHKPTVFINPNEIRCDDCCDEYPCPTIQAIEEELE